MKKHDGNPVVNMLGVGELVELIDTLSTINPQSVVDVVNDIEKFMSAHRTLQRVQQVGYEAIRAIWFGWRATMGWNGYVHVYGKPAPGVTKEFVIKCIALGTNIASKQRQMAQHAVCQHARA
jgi:hypothetical protein